MAALAANFIFELPFYKEFVAPQYKETSLRITTGKEEYNKAYDYFTPEENMNTHIRELAPTYRDDNPLTQRTRRFEFYNNEQTNFFARKPFNCLFCMSFWWTLGGLVFILFFKHSVPVNTLAVPMCAAVLAEAFNRWFKSLPLSL